MFNVVIYLHKIVKIVPPTTELATVEVLAVRIHKLRQNSAASHYMND